MNKEVAAYAPVDVAKIEVGDEVKVLGTQKPKTKPVMTPTLDDVKKLAWTRGDYTVTHARFRRANNKKGTYPHLVMDVGVRRMKGMDLLMQVFPKTRRQGQAMLYAALLVLPDVKGRK
jgi:hypothetical protein